MVAGVRGAATLIAVVATLATTAADAHGAIPAGTCVQPGYHCAPTGRWRESATNTDKRCTWTYNVSWGDGATSFFVPSPGDEAHADHRFDASAHHLFKVVIDIPLGFSSDPNVRCTGGRYSHRVEIPGPAVKPCVPARRTKPPACQARGVKSGSSLLDQVPRLGRTTLDFLLMSDIRTLRRAKSSAREEGLIVASYLVPQKRLAVLGDGALDRLGSKAGPKVLDGLLPAEAKLVTKGDRGAIVPSFRTAESQVALTRALLKDPDGTWIGESDGTAYVVELTASGARDLFRQLSRLGDTVETRRGATTVSLAALPNGDRAEFTTAGPGLRYFTAATGRWTSFRFVVAAGR